MATTSGPPEPDPITEALIGSDLKAPDLAVLRGYLGRSPTATQMRLYLPALDGFIEIGAADILYSRKLPNDGGTEIWVSRDFVQEHLVPKADDAEGPFLTGLISERELARLGGTLKPYGGTLSTCGTHCRCLIDLDLHGTVSLKPPGIELGPGEPPGGGPTP
jgi:hypothetical protein